MFEPELYGHSASSSLPLVSVCIALFGSFNSGIAYVIVRKLSRSEDSSVIVFYFPMVALPVSVLLLFIRDSFVMPDLHLTFFLVLIGIFTQIGQVGLTKAMQTQSASRASAYSYVQIIFSGLIGIVAFDEIPSQWTYLGAIMIMAGAMVNVFGSQIKETWYRKHHHHPV